jgi:hypothetical protein
VFYLGCARPGEALSIEMKLITPAAPSRPVGSFPLDDYRLVGRAVIPFRRALAWVTRARESFCVDEHSRSSQLLLLYYFSWFFSVLSLLPSLTRGGGSFTVCCTVWFLFVTWHLAFFTFFLHSLIVGDGDTISNKRKRQ